MHINMYMIDIYVWCIGVSEGLDDGSRRGCCRVRVYTLYYNTVIVYTYEYMSLIIPHMCIYVYMRV